MGNSSSSGKYFKNFKFDGENCAAYGYGSFESSNIAPEDLINKSVITKIEIWKVPLLEWIPFDFGLLYHAYLVLQTRTRIGGTEQMLRWSFEKNTKRIYLQYSTANVTDVITKFEKENRLTRSFWSPHKLDEYELEQDMQMNDIFTVCVKTGNSLFYDMIFSNCKDFAQDIFNDINKKLRRDFEACGFKSYMMKNVSNALFQPKRLILDIWIRLHIISFCYLQCMFAPIYWTLFIRELSYGSLSKFEIYNIMDEPKKSNKSRFIQIYDYE